MKIAGQGEHEAEDNPAATVGERESGEQPEKRSATRMAMKRSAVSPRETPARRSSAVIASGESLRQSFV